MKNIILLWVVLACIFQAKAQQAISFPTPDAASLGTYGNIPVNLHTGRVNLSIPLFDIKEFDYPISVSLSYNTAGLQPHSRPGWVGQNWTLNAGGVIMRSVKGYRDEYVYQGYFRHNKRLGGSQWASWDNIYHYYYEGKDINSAVDSYYYDFEPDEFYFNMNGRSGKFYYDGSNFISPGNPGLRINFNYNPRILISVVDNVAESSTETFNGFTITDESGIMYHFGYNADLIEMSTTTDIGASTSLGCGVASSWYLAEIEFPNREEKIKFKYYPKQSDRMFSYMYNSFGLHVNQAWEGKGVAFFVSCPNCGFTGSGTRQEEFQIFQSHTYLKEIEGTNFKLKFNAVKANDLVFTPYETQRDAQWKKLTGIVLERKGSNNEATVVRGYSLNYSEERRLALTSVYETDRYGVQNAKGYQMAYEVLWAVPGYSFTGIDHWGYYNGSTGSLIEPEAKPGYVPKNRYASPKHALYGNIRSIQYPTGGKTLFEFEGNDFSSSSNSNNIVIQTDEVYWEDHVFRSMNEDFYLDKSTEVELKIVHTLPMGTQRDSTIIYMRDGTYNIGYLMDQQFGWGGFDTFTIRIKKTMHIEDIIPGTDNLVNALIGGLRIKRMIDLSASNAQDSIIHEFKYTKGNTKESSGSIGKLPVYLYMAKNGNQAFGALSIQSFSPLNYTEGSHVGYSEVKETLKDRYGTQLGYNVYKYTSFDTHPDAPATYRVTIMEQDIGNGNSMEIFRGKLLSETSYNANNKVVRRKEYNYSTIAYSLFAQTIKGIQCKTVVDPAMNISRFEGQDFKNVSPAFAISAYEIPAGGNKLTKETETLYDADGNNPHVTTTNYTYNQYELPSEIKKNSVLKTVRNYPFDFNTEFYTQLVDAFNIINYPIEEIVYSNNAVSDKKMTTYRNSEELLYRDLINCHKVFSYDSYPTSPDNTAEAKAELEFLTYNASGNPLEMKDRSGMPTTYLWSYRGEYPIAEIKNATLEQVKGQLGIDVETLRKQVVPDMAKIEALRSKMPYAQITTYTYLPLVGIKSMTDAKGLTTTYEYDSYGRLSKIVNADAKILKALEYNYKH